MSYHIKCKKCLFDTFAESKENADRIQTIHIDDCQNDAADSDIFVGGGYHRLGQGRTIHFDRLNTLISQKIKEAQYTKGVTAKPLFELREMIEEAVSEK